jgi:two-component system cell cycle sensor histidine kinase PleC
MRVRLPSFRPPGALALPHLEIAARYLWSNLLPLPLVVVGLGAMLTQWFSVASLGAWGIASVLTWSVTLTILRVFLHDRRRGERVLVWTIVICVALFISSLTFASVAPLFWVVDNRLNNVLLYVVLAAGLACAGAQSAPSVPVVVTNIAPYAMFFVGITLANEPYPTGPLMAFLQLCYIGLVATYSKAVWQLTHEMLTLREDKESLIAKLRGAVEDANAARARAERASTAKSEFLANMSHELRTPLNAVLGFSEVIKDLLFGRDAIDRYADYAANVHASGSHLLGLINDILDLSKIEAGKWQLKETRFSLVAQAREALRFIEPQAKQKSLRLLLDSPHDVTLIADERAIRQILINLLANAVKFTQRGGTVTVALRCLSDRSGQIAVSDTGIGIARQDLDYVLENFGQGRHDVATTEDRGTGLGLPIVKGLVQAHGGSLRIESEVGVGTSVIIDLPASRVVEASDAVDQPIAAAS